MTLNHSVPGADCDLDYVRGQSRPYPIRTALNLSSGFGGQELLFGPAPLLVLRCALAN